MRKTMKQQGMGILAGLLIIPITAWAGEIRIENETGSTIRISCGDHGSAGHTGNIHHGHHRTLHVSHHGGVGCRALNHDGHTVASRSFHFDHYNTHYRWHVVVHHGGAGDATWSDAGPAGVGGPPSGAGPAGAKSVEVKPAEVKPEEGFMGWLKGLFE
ncbi:MAG TPA: hypothetical protein ENI80_10415 [Acidiferrobacteraceae bacterium]|nr:hypothetical protein [Acidiferrobacteraceae bacterium]